MAVLYFKVAVTRLSLVTPRPGQPLLCNRQPQNSVASNKKPLFLLLSLWVCARCSLHRGCARSHIHAGCGQEGVSAGPCGLCLTSGNRLAVHRPSVASTAVAYRCRTCFPFSSRLAWGFVVKQGSLWQVYIREAISATRLSLLARPHPTPVLPFPEAPSDPTPPHPKATSLPPARGSPDPEHPAALVSLPLAGLASSSQGSLEQVRGKPGSPGLSQAGTPLPHLLPLTALPSAEGGRLFPLFLAAPPSSSA